MNKTGRLPAVLLVHLKMHVRITVSDERLAAHAPVDTIGVVQNIELHPIDQARWLQQARRTHLRVTLCTYNPRAHNRRRNREGTRTRHRRSRGCHLPAIHDRARTGRPAVLQSTFVESEGCERASALDNLDGVNPLHTTGHYVHAWPYLSSSHTSPVSALS